MPVELIHKCHEVIKINVADTLTNTAPTIKEENSGIIIYNICGLHDNDNSHAG